MKTIISLIILLLVCACTHNQNNDALRILVDKTDSMQVLTYLKSQDLLKYLTFQQDKYAGVDIGLVPITNLRLNQKYHLEVTPTEPWNANELKRKQLQKSTNDWLDSVLNDIKSQPIGRDQSRIFEALSIELNALAELPHMTRKNLILISDLGQNSDFCNVYDSVGFETYIAQPPRFFKLLDEHCPIRFSLKTVTVYFVYQAKDERCDRRFYVVANLLKQYLELKGATVHISANL